MGAQSNPGRTIGELGLLIQEACKLRIPGRWKMRKADLRAALANPEPARHGGYRGWRRYPVGTPEKVKAEVQKEARARGCKTTEIMREWGIA